jgi:photosystem II stability/assembly factor-like uncharacterized protein
MWRSLTGTLVALAALNGCGGDASAPTATGTVGGHMWAVGEAGLMSADDGATLVARATPVASTLRTLLAVDDQLAWAFGDAGTILGTHDGGATWQVQPSPVATTLWAAAFADAGHGYAVGGGGVILRTQDAGRSWNLLTSPVAGTAIALRGVAVAASGGLVLTVGDGGVVLRSLDGGGHFDTAPAPTAADLRAVRLAADELHAVAVGAGGAVLTSDDGGASWRTQNPAPAELRAVAIDHDQTVAVGARGLIWRRASASGDFTTVPSGTTADLNAVKFDRGAPATGWVVGGDGIVLVTHDGGAHFGTLASLLRGNLTAVEDF